MRKASSILKVSVIAGALLCAPVATRAQNTDSTTVSTTTTETGRHFDWGWLGLLGLLGLIPRKRKETVVETRTTTGPGTGPAARY